MKKLILIAALVLGGCASEAEKAEAEYEMVAKNSPRTADRCGAAEKVRDAYLRQGDEWNYRLWRSTAASCRMIQ